MLKKSKMDNKPEAEMEYESKKGGGLFEALHEKKESKSKKMSERKMGGKS